MGGLAVIVAPFRLFSRDRKMAPDRQWEDDRAG
jgi:hypothetical protein